MEEISKIKVEDLVEQAKVSKESFSELYRLFLPKIFSYVSWRVGSRTDAEDIVSEIFMRVVKNLSSYTSRPEATFQSWLYQIAKHAIADFYRRRKPQEVVVEELPEVVASFSLEEEFDTRALFAEVFQLLEKMFGREAEILRLKFSMGLKNNEIAVMLGLNEKSISSSVSKGIKKIKKMCLL
jgi:RNA polymerase sigma-70 factor (ECF subfamily)